MKSHLKTYFLPLDLFCTPGKSHYAANQILVQNPPYSYMFCNKKTINFPYLEVLFFKRFVRQFIGVISISFLGLLLCLISLNGYSQGASKTFTVNVTGDEEDPDADLFSDGHCDVDPNTQGDQCTFRAAIQNHNANRNLPQNTINFNIPNAPGSGSIVIKPGITGLGPLPPVLGSVITNAKNEPDGRRIELDGSSAGGNAIGLKLLGGQCQVSFFIINNFSSHGIFISGTPPPGEGSHIIKGNYIGTDETGKISKGNGGDGIFIDNTGNNTVGGTTFEDLNIISGNIGYGIVIHGADPAVDFLTNGASNNMVKGNFIGLDVDGNLVLPNEMGGVLNENAANNRIGDSTDIKAANKFAGVKNGITVKGSLSEGVGIEGNFFQNGSGAKFTAGIFGRGGKGLYVTGNFLENIDSTAIDLFINANGNYNIRKNRFEGNMKTGTKLRFENGLTTEVDYENNFHTGAGLSIDAEESLNSRIDWLFAGDTIKAGEAGANLIFKAAGNKNFTNNRWEAMASFGLNFVSDIAPGLQATIKETNEVYANNGTEGVHGRIQGSGELALTIFGTKSTGNGTDGSRLDVFVSAGAKVDITARENQYILSGRAGLRITGDGQKSDLVTFIFERNLLDHDNFVGLELFNSAILRKSITNNTITNNSGPGILLGGNSDAHIDNNTISGNSIGILINDVATGLIDNNTLTQNGKGIALAGTGSGIAINSNLIFDNLGLGIDLGNDGVTPNHLGGQIPGPNHFQNHPVLINAETGGAKTIVRGNINSDPNAVYRMEFFSNNSCNPTGFGDGQQYIGFKLVTTDASGNASFSDTLTGVTTPVGSAITSTATDSNFNTSEFSACVQASVLPLHLISFTAKAAGNFVKLGWMTANEQNIKYFDVEHSADGRVFTKLGQVQASFNSTVQNTYSFIDSMPLQKINFYRLRMVDADGTYTYSMIEPVTINTHQHAFSIFPNPASDKITIQIFAGGLFELRLVNADGMIFKKEVLQLPGNTPVSMNVSSLPKGVYFLIVQNSTYIKYEKLIKQ